jgi:hypothetical protein
MSRLPWRWVIWISATLIGIGGKIGHGWRLGSRRFRRVHPWF